MTMIGVWVGLGNRDVTLYNVSDVMSYGGIGANSGMVGGSLDA
jgi:hypothetical protein